MMHQRQQNVLHICTCCRRNIKVGESRIPTNEKTSNIFSRLIGFQLPPGSICGKCNVSLLTFENFYNDLFKKHFYLNRKPAVFSTPKNLLEQPFAVTSRLGNLKETLNPPPERKPREVKSRDVKAPTKVTRLVPGQKRIADESEKPKKADKKRKVFKLPQNMEPVDKIVVKEEPVEADTVTAESVDVSTVKVEPVDLPDLETIEIPQNVVIKEEYELSEDMDVTAIPLADPDEEDVRQAIIDAFSSQNELVLRDTVKEKLQRRQITEMRRKTMALSIPQDVNEVRRMLVKEQAGSGTLKPQRYVPDRVPKPPLPGINEIDSFRYSQFKCEHCDISSRSKAQIISHIKEMHAFHCTVCQLIFPTAAKLAQHKETQHDIKNSNDGGRRKQTLKAIKETAPAAFRLHTKQIDLTKKTKMN